MVEMKIVVAIDSFKGSLCSLQAGNAVKDAICRLDGNAEVLVKPLADGGEGTVEALSECSNSEIVELIVKGPLLKPVVAKYCVLKDNNTAIIEMVNFDEIASCKVMLWDDIATAKPVARTATVTIR